MIDSFSSRFMKSTLPNDLLKSKSQAASHPTTQTMKAGPPAFSDRHPGSILQKKMQDAANASSQVMQLQDLQAMADRHTRQASSSAVVQRIKGEDKDEITNTYSEVGVKLSKNKTYITRVGKLPTKEKTLVKEKVYRAGTTDETGYKVLKLEEGEKQEDWTIMNSVLTWNEDGTLCTLNNFKLPVSCIESAEHVIYAYNKNEDYINDHNSKKKTKKVGLYFGELVEEGEEHDKKRKRDSFENTLAAKLDNDDLSQIDSALTDFDFESEPAEVGEGLFVQSKKTGSIFHAVAVVGKHTTGQLIVLERNAGNTSGDNIYLDKNWLVNVYNSEGAFRSSLGKQEEWRIGKLKVL